MKTNTKVGQCRSAEAAQIIVPSGKSTEGGEPQDATEAPIGLTPEMPKEGAEATLNAQISGAEEPTILAHPLQAIPFTEVPQSSETDPTQSSQKGEVPLSPVRPPPSSTNQTKHSPQLVLRPLPKPGSSIIYIL